MHNTGNVDFQNVDIVAYQECLNEGINHFRLEPKNPYAENDEKVQYGFTNKKQGGGKATGLFLAPTIITKDKNASKLLASVNKLYKSITIESYDPDKIDNMTQLLAPTSGEYANRKKPKTPIFEQICCAITTITPYKPAITRTYKDSGQVKVANYTIIPDLVLKDLILFIGVFKKMYNQKVLNSELFVGYKRKDGFTRPKISRGNFPYAPYSAALGVVGLIGAIGRWAREGDYIEDVNKVLESIKNRPLYVVSYGHAIPVSINHYIVNMAKENQLSTIIDSLYYVDILSSKAPRPKPQYDSNKYEVFDMFVSRFLQFFNKSAFNDFISVRAEYPMSLVKLFTTYFEKMELKDLENKKEIIESCASLGQWFNRLAYFVAKAEAGSEANQDKIRTTKAKVLVEIESAIFSARSGDELIGHALTRAGRLGSGEAPAEAALFMKSVASGEIKLDTAKNLIMAFSRIRNNKNPNETKAGEPVSRDLTDNSDEL